MQATADPEGGRSELAAIYSTIALSGLAYGGSQVVMSWLVVTDGGSALALGLLFAVRMSPLLVMGSVAGALADRVSRRDLLAWTNAGTAATFAGLTLTTIAGSPIVPTVFAGAIALGCLDAIRLTTTGTLVVDVAPSRDGPAAIAASQVAARVGAGLGGFSLGLLIESTSPALAFGTAATLSAIAAVVLHAINVAPQPDRQRESLGREVRQGLTLITRNRLVALLALIAVTAEIFGFSNDGILPIFANDVLALDAAGLGVLYLAVRVGSVIGLIVLVPSGTRLSGLTLLATLVAFGGALVIFGVSTVVLISLAALAFAGAAAAWVDTLEQSILQRAVADDERGRAMGIWTICLGFGPVGFVALGLLATYAGAQAAQVLAGACMIAAAMAIGLVPGAIERLRDARTIPAIVVTTRPSLVE